MKLLIHSNGPTVPTGYGVQTALLAERLKAAGHEVAISAYCGQPFGVGNWNGIRLYPGGYDSIGNDVLPMWANHWFEGDPTQGWIITLTDVFGLYTPKLADWQVAAWTPIDHWPLTADQIDFFKRTGARPIAMSRFGEGLLREAGYDPMYVPLALHPDYKPTKTIDGRPAREIMGVPEDAFVVMMNAMNKGTHFYDRKGFEAAFRGFGRFAADHPDAVLYMHTHMAGTMGSADLWELAVNCGIALHQIKPVDVLAYQIGLPTEYLAACYTAADVLLAPSAGEGFCVPLLEAQACGTPVIVSDFSAQPELVGGGWKVPGHLRMEWSQKASVFTADYGAVAACLTSAYDARHTSEYKDMQGAGFRFVKQYKADKVFEDHWVPTLAALDNKRTPLDLDRDQPFEVAVVVPTLNRPQNVAPLVESFLAASDTRFLEPRGPNAILYLIAQEDDTEQVRACVEASKNSSGLVRCLIVPADCTTFAQKVNAAYEQTTEPFLFITGDDVEFTEGWLEAAAKYADTYDVIGTSDGGANPRVTSGVHADHFFIRREYIDRYGASLDGPGIVCHEGYKHFFVDWEIIELAKHRGVFTPCLESVVVHNRVREADDTDRLAASSFEDDKKKWPRRAALIAQAA